MRDAPASLADLFEQTSDCLVFFDVQSLRRLVIESFNPAAAATFHLDAGCVGRPADAVLPREAVEALTRGVRLGPGTATAEHRWPLPGGARWFHAVMVPICRQGHPPHRLAVTWRDVTAQKAFEQVLCDREEMFRRLVETTSAVPWEADLPTRRFRYVGPQAMERFGYALEEWYADGFWERLLHPDDRDATVDACACLARTQRAYSLEYRVVTRAGEVLWVHDLVSVVADGPDVLLRGFLVDVTARRQAEEQIRQLNEQLEARVAERTVQLAAANRELEAFCYSVSHDLRAPLRAIDGFSRALLEDYDRRLDDDGRDMLRRVRAASQRMAELIDDLLTMSRVSRGDMVRTRVSLSRLAQAVAAGLRQSAPQRRAEWLIEPDLEAEGDPALLRVLLENLLGNAWKYTSRHDAARIEFGRTAEDPPRFFVRDDGDGFDERYAAKLFQPFGRLHRADEFDGHGIGLATVQRIVHRHGGRVSATGAVGKGATVYFTL